MLTQLADDIGIEKLGGRIDLQLVRDVDDMHHQRTVDVAVAEHDVEVAERRGVSARRSRQREGQEQPERQPLHRIAVLHVVILQGLGKLLKLHDRGPVTRRHRVSKQPPDPLE